MDLGLTDKVAIVGGGSDGLGFAIADRLLNEGAFVTILGRRAEKAAAAAEELSRRHGENKVLGLAADCSNADDIGRVTASTVARFGAPNRATLAAHHGRSCQRPSAGRRSALSYGPGGMWRVAVS
ncbi:SDR family NAD(P)-dependent oxidoreductase [Streptomyces sp. TG1A-8]|uniref:SDR family NAD(P)-dependent oxidoreductase n=1 Tax=Streptomyces sp. TG1A-8 TaxID=3051385 RepID=UPI00265C132D|nr:SDR family NAD(P)-dependent oxidoreductase [Streptomyces sp. TG1A-8]MDO0928765.1 SDR family NAD(P)-dependent oxidoreductase [Streptomyces sp. TG1A-8]